MRRLHVHTFTYTRPLASDGLYVQAFNSKTLRAELKNLVHWQTKKKWTNSWNRPKTVVVVTKAQIVHSQQATTKHLLWVRLHRYVVVLTRQPGTLFINIERLC